LTDGVQAVREALHYGAAELLLVAEPLLQTLERGQPATAASAQLAALAQLLVVAEQFEIPVVSLTEAEDRQLTDAVSPQGIFAVCPKRHSTLAALSDVKLAVICVEVRDPGNAGTIIRAADAFGAAAVVFTRGSVEVENAKTVRASVGSLFHLPVVQQVTFDETVAWARDNGMRVLAADAAGSALTEVPLDAPTAWVFGNEAWGFPPDVLTMVDQVVAVPMYGKAESLNVATAAAICLYATATAQRR
jgi:TrmH family RNA methyltransferase